MSRCTARWGSHRVVCHRAQCVGCVLCVRTRVHTQECTWSHHPTAVRPWSFQGSMGRCSQVGRELTLVSCVMYLCGCGMGLGACCFQPLLTHRNLEPARHTPWFQCPGFLKESKNFLSPLPLRITHGDGYKLLNKQHLEKQWLILTISEGSVGSAASELSREGPGLNPTA